MEAWAERHLQNWVKANIPPRMRVEVEKELKALVAENPKFLETKSWPEMLKMCSSGGVK